MVLLIAKWHQLVVLLVDMWHQRVVLPNDVALIVVLLLVLVPTCPAVRIL